jgi:hypothetical protein
MNKMTFQKNIRLNLNINFEVHLDFINENETDKVKYTNNIL